MIGDTAPRIDNLAHMSSHPWLDALGASLVGLVPEEPADLHGEWLPSERRTYAAPRQGCTASGPLVDVVDLRWRGQLTCTVPLAGIGFIVTSTDLFWAKSIPAAPALPVVLSLHAYADYSAGHATFTAGIGGALLPGVRVAHAVDDTTGCTVDARHVMTGRVTELARLGDVVFAVLLIQGRFLRTGRHRLWRLREEFAGALPEATREILTRRRAGRIHSAS